MAIKVGTARKPLENESNLRTLRHVRAYQTFDQLDGQHPWMKIVPEGYVPYRVRELKAGEVAYFNFALAKDMGLLPPNHPHQMNAELKAKILSTFCLQIINEYDVLKNRDIDPSTVKPHTYMATRYLQLQHSNKSGKTSGDGRGIWNGVIDHKGTKWDVSSRGTGVTRLAPGAVEAQRPLRTGSTKFGYGCGQAEIDELYGAAIFAELMYLQGIHTERVLCVIDLGRGYGIGVRAAPNLLRPAHLFLLHKQNRLKDLRAAVDYLLDRQQKNKKWKIQATGLRRYSEFLELTCDAFAQFLSYLEVDYIFAWLDWDGDNVLADGGIIDYGSIRQFGVRHDKYRYDDVIRYSTCLNDQRVKGRMVMQVYAQMVHYLKTGKKLALTKFERHSILKTYDQSFKRHRAERLMYRMGFDSTQRKTILAKKGLFDHFDRVYTAIETAKIRGSTRKVADGVNHPARFDLRPALRELPKHFAEQGWRAEMIPAAFLKLILSDFARGSDCKMRPQELHLIKKFQKLYRRVLFTAVAKKENQPRLLKEIADRAAILNREDRMTGNALIQIVDEIIRHRRRGAPHEEIQGVIDQLILNAIESPEGPGRGYHLRGPREIKSPELLNRILEHLITHRHDI